MDVFADDVAPSAAEDVADEEDVHYLMVAVRPQGSGHEFHSAQEIVVTGRGDIHIAHTF
jgi:hypothetical protein